MCVGNNECVCGCIGSWGGGQQWELALTPVRPVGSALEVVTRSAGIRTSAPLTQTVQEPLSLEQHAHELVCVLLGLI